MKRPISLWIISILGIITDIFSGAIICMGLIMPAQAFFWNQFIAITLLLLLLFIVSIIGLFKLKKWGRNIFVTLTLIMNLSMVVLLSRLNIFHILNTIFIFFILSFSIYFLHPSVRRLFK